METNHTPGPWKVEPWVRSAGRGVYCVISAEGKKLSSVSVYGRDRSADVGGKTLRNGDRQRAFTESECDANARLIAAAPDLLADGYELHEATEEYFAIPSVENMNRLTAALRKHRAAIAKATKGE